MTDAPEKLWAKTYILYGTRGDDGEEYVSKNIKRDFHVGTNVEIPQFEQTKYTRTDVTEARITELEAALERIAEASDYYGKEASDHDELALAYAHQSTNRLARAALKGDANED